MASSDCLKIVGGCLVELNRLDSCGLPLIGALNPNNTIRTKGLIQIEFTPDIDAGTDVVERTMCGDLCINEKDCPIIKGFTGKMRLCAIDPTILEMLVGVTPIFDTVIPTNIIGGSLKGESRSQCNKFALKVWGTPPNGCSNGNPYAIFSLPYCENAVISSTITFAHKQAQLWEIDFYAREGNAAFLDPAGIFTPTEVRGNLMSWKSSAVLPSSIACGYVTL